MKWTKDLPDCAGYWWWRFNRKAAPRPIHVEMAGIAYIEYWCNDSGSFCRVSEMGGEWSDTPIPEPKGRKKALTRFPVR